MIYLKLKSLISNQKTGDLFSKNDLFIEIEYGKDRRRTTTLWNNNTPTWNELFLFNKTETSKIILKIKDEDVWGKDEELLKLEIDVYYGKVKSFKNEYIEYDMGDIYNKARIINAKNKKTIKQHETTIQQLNTDIEHLKITNNELKNSLETVVDENETMYGKLAKVNKIVKKYGKK